MSRPPRLRCVELRPAHWPAIERLFGERGACGGCWCMWWRVPKGGETWRRTRGAPAKRAFRKLVTGGAAMGVLAFDGDEPVGWCAFGPRPDFPRTERVRAYRDSPGREEAWSVNCFFIARDRRGQGVASALLAAAVKAARRRGARLLEGYPVTGRLPAAFAWTGPLSIFARAGFETVRAEPASRPLVQLRLRR